MKKITPFMQKIENVIMIITFTIMVIASFAQVVNRNFTKLPITWFEELSVYCMIYMVLFGTELGLRDGTQIEVTSIVDKFKGKLRKSIRIVSKIIVVLFSVMIFTSSLNMVKMQIASGQTSSALRIPMSIPYAALPLSFGVISIVQAFALFIMIKEFNNKEEVE